MKPWRWILPSREERSLRFPAFRCSGLCPLGTALLGAVLAWGLACLLLLSQRETEEARRREEALAFARDLGGRMTARSRGILEALGDLPAQWRGRAPSEGDFDLAARALTRLYPEVRLVFLLHRGQALRVLDPEREGRSGERVWQFPPVRRALARRDLRERGGVAGPLDLPGDRQGILVVRSLKPELRGAGGPLGALLSLPEFLEASGFPPEGMEGALSHRGRVFRGDPLVFTRRPVRLFVSLPPEGWDLALRPPGGWRDEGKALRGFAGLLTAAGGVSGLLLGKVLEGRLRRRRQDARSGGRYRELVESVPDVIWEVDPQGFFTYVSPQAGRPLGVNPEELLGRTPFSLMPHQEGVRMQKLFRIRAAKGEDFLWEESAWIGRDALVYWETSGLPFYDETGTLRGYRGVNRDVTDRKLRELELDGKVEEIGGKLEALRRAVALDPLTEALNRRSLEEALVREMRIADRYGNPLAVILCDLDRFKSINDRFGHQEGDCALRAFSRIVRGCLRSGDLFGRWGGEEFLVVAPVDAPGGAALAEKLREELETVTRATPVPLTASFGVSVYVPGEPLEVLVQRADEAMYRAKEGGRNRVESA